MAGFSQLKSPCSPSRRPQAVCHRGKCCLAHTSHFLHGAGKRSPFSQSQSGQSHTDPLSSLAEGAEPGWLHLPGILKPRARSKQIFAMVFGAAAQRLATDTHPFAQHKGWLLSTTGTEKPRNTPELQDAWLVCWARAALLWEHSPAWTWATVRSHPLCRAVKGQTAPAQTLDWRGKPGVGL